MTNNPTPPGSSDGWAPTEQEALAEIERRARLGKDVIRELQAAMDDHYKVIREYLGQERGPGFAHRVNSMLLRASGHFFQINERVAEISARAKGDSHDR
jgi:hypothetical protein